jgi:hypothetical protein
MLNERFNRIKQKGIEEARKLFWIFVYLWALLSLFAVHKALVLNEPSLFYHGGFAVINAWLLAKVMLAAEMLHIADNLKHKPLIYPIVFKSAVFSVILISFYYIEEIVVAMWKGETFADSVPAIGLKGELVVAMIMFVVLMPFFALRELGRDIGADKLYEQFFVRRTKFSPQPSGTSH